MESNDLHSYRLVYEVRGKDECYFVEACNREEAIEQVHKDWHRTSKHLVECVNMDRL